MPTVPVLPVSSVAEALDRWRAEDRAGAGRRVPRGARVGAGPGLAPIALDGKTLRGALRAKATATHLVSVFAHRARLVVGQLAVAEKSNEIPCLRALLKLPPRPVRWLARRDRDLVASALGNRETACIGCVM